MRRLPVIFFLSVIIILMCLVFVGITRRAINGPAYSQSIYIDWEKIYPFDENTEIPRNKKESFADYLKTKIEDYTSSKMPGGMTMIEAGRIYEELIGWNMAAIQGYNPVIKLNDGYLSDFVASRDVSQNAEAVKGLSDFCKSLGIEYMYINYPAKICVSEDSGISGVLDFSNQNTDNLLSMLKEACVRAYDLRKLLHEDGMKHHEAFFRTDHHWKPETGLWAARHILQFLREDYGWDVKPEMLRPENFEHVVYPEWFLGSEGKKVTLARTTPDDFTMLYPKFKTSLHYQIPSLGIDISGDFAVTYDMKCVETKDYYVLGTYGAYNYGDSPLCMIHNPLCSNDKRILIIHDSFSNCVIPFLALDIKNVDAIDIRNFTGSLRTYIKTVRPDAVITAYYSTVPGRDSSKPGNNHYDLW